MKKVLSLAFLAALFLICLPSCTKPETKFEDLIVGKWIITYAEAGEGFGGEICEIEEAKGETWTFKDNGKFYGCLMMWVDGDYGRFLGKSRLLDPYFECDWHIEGNELVFKGGDFDVEFIGHDGVTDYMVLLDIEQLDEKKLVVSGRVRCESDGYPASWPLRYELEAK
jgi:hypothetical protein